MLPGVRLGAAVTGASFCPLDGDTDPLNLLRALHAALDAERRRLGWSTAQRSSR